MAWQGPDSPKIYHWPTDERPNCAGAACASSARSRSVRQALCCPVARPLSEGGLGVFVVSTFDGDHLLIKQAGQVMAAELPDDLKAKIAKMRGLLQVVTKKKD